MDSVERLAEALDWFEDAVAALRRQAPELARLVTREHEAALREREIELREQRLRDAGAAHTELTARLEARTGVFERQALELEAGKERLRAQAQLLAERAAELDRRALAVSERAAQLDERATAVDAMARDLERFADRARARAAELDARERDLTAAQERVTELEVRAEHAAWVLRPVAVGERSGAWTLDALRDLALANPAREDELLAYLRQLRDFADVDGRLPSSFDALIDDVFRPTTRSARRGDGGA